MAEPNDSTKSLAGFARAAGLCGMAAVGYLFVAALMTLAAPVGLGETGGVLYAGLAQCLALLLPGILAAKAGGLSLGSLGLRPGPKGAVRAWMPLFLGAAMAANLLAAGLRQLAGRSPEVTVLPAGGAALAAACLVSCLLPALLEEWMFRGVMEGLLAPYGDGATIVGKAVLFALLHSEPGQCLTALVCGLVLGLLARRAGSIRPGAALHLVNNLLAFASQWMNQYGAEDVALLLELVLAVGGPAWGLWALWHRRKRSPAWERPLRPGLAPWKLAVCPAYVVAAAALLARLVLS